jgi:transposase
MARREVSGGDFPALLDLIGQLRAKAARGDKPADVVVIQEVGMDGFWIHRALSNAGIESWLVDPASVAVSRRHRRAKTDKIDGEALVRVLMAFKRGEPRVCAMAVPPSPAEEDRRRVGRERKTLIHARVAETNCIKGLLFTQGIRGYQPLDKNRREKLKTLRTGDGRPLPPCLLQEIIRGLDRPELILGQIAATEVARTELAKAVSDRAAINLLPQIRGIGPCRANVIWSEVLYRSFENRRQVAAHAGLTPTPFKSGDIDQEQGISKSGNGRLRTAMVELAWLWIKWQPDSALTKWFLARVAGQRGRIKRVLVVALARKLLIALWRFCRDGIVPEGIQFKAA